MDQSQLLSEETNAGAELVRRLDKSIPVKAAFWVKDGDGGRWALATGTSLILGWRRGLATGDGDIPNSRRRLGSLGGFTLYCFDVVDAQKARGTLLILAAAWVV